MKDLLFRRRRDEGGFTVIELLVAAGIFSVLGSLLFGVVLNTSLNAGVVRRATDLNEESRLVMNRMSRELRQAARIVSVLNPDVTGADGAERICGLVAAPCFDPAADVGVTFQVDFNRDGKIDFTGSDAEQITYCYDKAGRRLLMQATAGAVPPCVPDPAAAVYPILSANVGEFKVTYRSSDYRCDTNADGTVTWQELETAPSPCPAAAGELIAGVSRLDRELDSVDQIILELSVLASSRTQSYRTKIDLRNQT